MWRLIRVRLSACLNRTCLKVHRTWALSTSPTSPRLVRAANSHQTVIRAVLEVFPAWSLCGRDLEPDGLEVTVEPDELQHSDQFFQLFQVIYSPKNGGDLPSPPLLVPAPPDLRAGLVSDFLSSSQSGQRCHQGQTKGRVLLW